VRRRLGDYSWRPDRGIPLSDALAELLDDLDRRTPASGSKMPIDPLPFSSGVDALDEVLEGGLRRGVVTVIEARLPAAGAALAYTIARAVDEPALLVAAEVLEATGWLVAGASGVPAVSVFSGSLTEIEWAAVARAVAELAHRPVSVSDVRSLSALDHVLFSEGRPPALLILEPTRFGPIESVVPRLSELADRHAVAVCTFSGPVEELPPLIERDVRRVWVADSELGSRATLVSADDELLLRSAAVTVDGLRGVVWDVVRW
jgi:hypothetical protein